MLRNNLFINKQKFPSIINNYRMQIVFAVKIILKHKLKCLAIKKKKKFLIKNTCCRFITLIFTTRTTTAAAAPTF